MNIVKRNRYIINLYPALHTISIKARQVQFPDAFSDGLIKYNGEKVSSDGEVYYSFIINPNKITGHSMLKTFSEFMEVLQQILKKNGVAEYQIVRADLSFNSDDSADYELFKKLNRLLICCIAQEYNIQNCYQSYNLWTNQSLSIAVKNDRIEAENYNKALESQGKVETKNRLELRSKRMTGSLQEEFTVKWAERLNKAVEQFENVQRHYNNELVKLWKADREKSWKEQDYTSMTDFLLRFKDCIFTRKQLVTLFTELGAKNPVNAAKRFKEKHTIEFFSKTDLKMIVKALNEKSIAYFNN